MDGQFLCRKHGWLNFRLPVSMGPREAGPGMGGTGHRNSSERYCPDVSNTPTLNCMVNIIAWKEKNIHSSLPTTPKEFLSWSSGKESN